MSKITPESAKVKYVFNGFDGIRSDAEASGIGALEMRNFRIAADGTLEKRDGWSTLYCDGYGLPRGFWQGCLNNTPQMFLVSGETIYRFNGIDATPVGELPDNIGDVQFVFYRDRLYLLDGFAIRVYCEDTDQFKEALGYVPLYGYNWHPTDLGSIYEPLNYFTPHLRVHYLNTTSSSTFRLPFYASAIDGITVDGKKVTSYDFLSPSNTVTINTVGASVEIAFSVDPAQNIRLQLAQCQHGYVNNDYEREVMFLYGASQGYRLFGTATVSDLDLKSCKILYPNADPLYFKAETMLLLGDTEHPVTALCANRGRILAFNKTGIWSIQLSEESDRLESYRLPRGVGCSTYGAVMIQNGDPIVTNESGIYRLSSTASAPDEFNATLLSEEIAPLVSLSFFKNMICYQNHACNEIWFRDRSEKEGVVYVYHTIKKLWYCFDFIHAKFFFQMDGKMGFATETSFCIFNGYSDTDDGYVITAYYQSGYLHFSSPETVKRALRLTLAANTNGNTVNITLDTEKQSLTLIELGSKQSPPEFFDKRVMPGRFRFLRFRISDSGIERSRYYRLALYANL